MYMMIYKFTVLINFCRFFAFEIWQECLNLHCICNFEIVIKYFQTRISLLNSLKLSVLTFFGYQIWRYARNENTWSWSLEWLFMWIRCFEHDTKLSRNYHTLLSSLIYWQRRWLYLDLINSSFITLKFLQDLSSLI